MHAVYPELALEDESGSVGRLSYPRPYSEPPSPNSSRATTPIPSDEEPDDDEHAAIHHEVDEVDEEREVNSFPSRHCFIFSTTKVHSLSLSLSLSPQLVGRIA